MTWSDGAYPTPACVASSSTESEIMDIPIVVTWLMMALAVSSVAKAKGKNAFSWFIYGLLIWPIALVHIILTPAETPGKFVNIAKHEGPPVDIHGTLVREDGHEGGRAILRVSEAEVALRAESGESWKAKVPKVGIVLRHDGMLDFTYRVTEYHLRPDDVAVAGRAIGAERTCRSCGEPNMWEAGTCVACSKPLGTVSP